MTGHWRNCIVFAVAVGLILPLGPVRARTMIAEAGAKLTYRVTEGKNLNVFFRDGKVAAHLLLRSGQDPRILVAFPAGNSGVGVWFDHLAGNATWRLDRQPSARVSKDGKDRPLYGISLRATIDAPRLSIKQALLSNVRFLRDYQAVGKFPADVAAPMRINGRTVDYRRDRLDGAPGYRLTIKVLHGRLDKDGISAGRDGRIGLEIVAMSGDTPLSPLDGSNLLTDQAAPDLNARNALRFLSYREKFLAGSWRFNTYFGRDTLMSVRLLMPVLQPAAAEAGLNAVLARLSPNGEVAHEEGLSEFAVVEHRQNGSDNGDAATLDYGMIDDDYMLAPVMAYYLLDHAAGKGRAVAYLAQPVASESNPGTHATVGATLVSNLRFVLAAAKPFAADPAAAKLVAIKPGRTTGQWRDSNEGLGRGRYAYDVNAVFVPAALKATEQLLQAGLLDLYLTPADRETLKQAGSMAAVWNDKAPPLFRFSIPANQATMAIESYATAVGIDSTASLTSVNGQPVVAHALSLDENGAPVPILNSDEGFALLFGDPPPADLDTYVTSIMRPFPAGLMTDIGLLVANPVFADTAAQARFTKNDYHGTVVWSWQQAMLAAGLEQQLQRTDLPAPVREHLFTAQATLWRAIKAAKAVQSSELWSWGYKDGHFVVAPFGAGSADVDESNAAQLWSTVYLAVQPPK